nr:ATP-binding cassette domain-containing protein [Mesorhizobium sp. M00.F.Ca.ET.216.01.1.1]
MIELNLAERPPEKDYRHIVRLEGVQKFFGAIQAVRDIDFSVGRNEIVGLIGDNGAGKSTLIRDRELNLAEYSVRDEPSAGSASRAFG